MLPHEKEIFAFFEYSEKFLKLPKPCRKEQFEEISCKKWAINELASWLVDNPNDSPDDILMEFALSMRIVYDRKHIEMFRYAAEVALEIYDYFYTDWENDY